MSYPLLHDRVAGSGLYIWALAGENLGNRKVVYISNDGTWKLADATIAMGMPCLGLTMDIIASGHRGWILIKGFIGLSTWTWTVGGGIYVSEVTAGELTQTSPANPINIIQGIGYAESATQIFFSPRQILGLIGATFTKTVNISAEAFSKPAANSPAVVDQDNITLYSFAVNTSLATYKLPVPTDYASGGLKLQVIWTNDGGVDDNGTNIKAQIDYQVSTEGEIVSGSHTNSPKNVEDAYTSATGFIDCRTAYMTIADGDFDADDCIFIKLSFVTAPAVVLTCNPHLIGICLQYTAYAKGHT